MKIPKGGLCLFGILPALLLFLICAGAYAFQGGVVDTIKSATAPFHDKALAESTTEKTVLVKTRYQGGTFRTETRKDKMERFKCSQCHNSKHEVNVARAVEMAHGDIFLDHGGREKPLACDTCHHKADRDFLVTEKGVKVDMDHSYEMCGQCHFRQKKDWVGGAHGKRVDNWAGERVVKNCTACHNPHTPLFKKRWPATYSPPF